MKYITITIDMKNLELNKVSLAVFLTILATTTQAAEPPSNPTLTLNPTQRQQQRDEALQKQLQPEAVVQTGLEKQLQIQPQLQYLKSNSEDVCFEIKKFVLIGEDARQFTFAMRPVTQGQHNLIGRCIGVQGLNQALDLIQNSIIIHVMSPPACCYLNRTLLQVRLNYK